jgi:hypothetical protein
MERCSFNREKLVLTIKTGDLTMANLTLNHNNSNLKHENWFSTIKNGALPRPI